MVTALDGNVSIRLDNGNVLTTRSGINKGMISGGDLVEVTGTGVKVSGAGKASTEIGMHLFVYQKRPDVRAVVHAHPTYATAFATARIPLDKCVLPEVIVGLGAIPLADYATPSTGEVAASLEPFVGTSDAILLANHGVVTYGSDLQDAYFKMEKVEHAAHITFLARVLGGEHVLGKGEIEQLRQVSIASYQKDMSGRIPCATDTVPADGMNEDQLRRYISETLEKLGL